MSNETLPVFGTCDALCYEDYVCPITYWACSMPTSILGLRAYYLYDAIVTVNI